jgi:integrase
MKKKTPKPYKFSRERNGIVEHYVLWRNADGVKQWHRVHPEDAFEHDEMVARVAAQLADGIDPRNQSLSMADWIKEYFEWCEGRKAPGTLRCEREIIDGWQEWLKANVRGVHGPKDLEFRHFEKFQSFRRNSEKQNRGAGKVSSRRVNLEIRVLRFLCKWSTSPARRYMLADPTAGLDRLQEARPGTRPIPEQDRRDVEAALLASHQHVGRVHALIFRLLEETGMRPAECLTLRWTDIDFSTGRVQIQNSEAHTIKTYNPRKLLLSPATLQSLSEMGVGEPLAPVWPVSQNAFRLALAKAVKRANAAREKAELPKMKPFGMYALRHTRAFELFAAGASSSDVKHILGHRSLRTTDSYDHENQTSMDAAMQRTWVDKRVDGQKIIPLNTHRYRRNSK